jgi:hypothetical protein
MGRSTSTKLIFRAVPDIVVHEGNHGADGIAGEVQELPGATLLHAQLRARDVMTARIEKAQRLPSSLPSVASWHLRRLPTIDLDAEWRANSTWFGEIGPIGQKSRLRLDLRLRQCALRQRSFVPQGLLFPTGDAAWMRARPSGNVPRSSPSRHDSALQGAGSTAGENDVGGAAHDRAV